MPDVSVKFKIEGDSASLNKAAASGGKALDGVRGTAADAGDALKQLTGGMVSLGGALGRLELLLAR